MRFSVVECVVLVVVEVISVVSCTTSATDGPKKARDAMRMVMAVNII
jgi:hypothetical protein